MFKQVLPLVSQQLLLDVTAMAIVTKPLVPCDKTIVLTKMPMWKEYHLTAKEQYLHTTLGSENRNGCETMSSTLMSQTS